MADSSSSLQHSASNFAADSASIRPEAHDGDTFQASQREASAKLASEFFSGSKDTGNKANTASDTISGVERAAAVLGGGLKDGIVDSATHSLNLHTAQTVAESLGIGYGLGALAKAGPIGQKVAMVGGIAMGASWVYSELERGRPQATIGAVADAYDHKDHAAQDRAIVAATGGALAFETGLAFAAGGIGMKKGLELNTGWHVDAIAGAKSTFGRSVDFLAQDGRVNGMHVLGDRPAIGFGGKDNAAGTGGGIADQVRDITSGKSKGAGSFAEIQEQMTRSKMRDNDTHLIDGRSKLVDLESQHALIKGEESALAPRLNKAIKDKAELENLSGNLEQTIRIRQQSLTEAQIASRELPGKKKELDILFEAKQAAFKRQEPVGGQPVDQSLRDDFQTKHKQFLAEKAKYDDLKVDGGNDALARHRESLQEAKDALTQANVDHPAKVTAAQAEIDALNGQMSALKGRRLEVEAAMKPLVERYASRLSELVKDPSKLVQAQFEPPAAKAAPEVKAPKIQTETHEIVGSATTHNSALGAIDTMQAEVKAVSVHVGDTHVAAATVEAPIKAAPVVSEVAPVKATPVAVSEVAPLHADVAKPTTTLDRTASAETVVERLSPETQKSRADALKAIKGNELVREKEYVEKVLGEIANNTYRPTNRASIAEIKIDMDQRLIDVNKKLETEQPVKYTRAIKAVLQYGKSAAKQLADTPDLRTRDGLTEQALADIEGMMGRLPTSYKGYQGKLADLSEPGRIGKFGSPEKRFADVLEHLEGKVTLLDGSRARHVAEMAERQPTLKEIVRQLESSELPGDGSIILIGKDGKYLGPQGGTSPYFIEVARMENNGVGADGGGFNRFEHIQNDIAGAVVLRPIYDASGKPVPLGDRVSNGKPVYKKAVESVIGEVPEGIKPALNFVDILRRFAPSREVRPQS